MKYIIFNISVFHLNVGIPDNVSFFLHKKAHTLDYFSQDPCFMVKVELLTIIPQTACRKET